MLLCGLLAGGRARVEDSSRAQRLCSAERAE